MGTERASFCVGFIALCRFFGIEFPREKGLTELGISNPFEASVWTFEASKKSVVLATSDILADAG